MSSRRFPGKVLAKLGNGLLIDHVFSRLGDLFDAPDAVVLLTSTDISDDPLAAHAVGRGWPLFRGSLQNVMGRFSAALGAHPCQWFFRVCADSPLLDPDLFRRALALKSAELDLVTNVFPRTFPKGRSVELVRARTFLSLDPESATAKQQEHVTQVFYDAPHRYRILNFTAEAQASRTPSLVVDTPEDLRAVETSLCARKKR